jgi:hypothetical protein
MVISFLMWSYLAHPTPLPSAYVGRPREERLKGKIGEYIGYYS